MQKWGIRETRKDEAFRLSAVKKWAGRGNSPGNSQHFGKLRQSDHLRLGVRDQPGQYGETPSLLKIQKLDRQDGGHL